ncbi:ATP-dependent helicase HrpB [Labilithrix luteola]|uniref:ATP-dependent helicase HrpB n=1 Tax=Labilithrix luteola TaxID=1391654 RepID=A0A0K1Q611_9BACT|nr:ATP-dependent helicase HrpB [Labilithrix luteola]
MAAPVLTALPIDPILPDVVRSLAERASLVLEAPPGAGKTTRVPRALLDAGTTGEILVLEPRRLAARLAARRVADELGERLGDTVGYTVRFEDVSSNKTRVRFVTEGILTRRLLADPELRGVSTVLLDEFHERHLQGDVALALLRRLQQTKRLDLRLVAMSATLDAGPVAEYLDCPVLRSEGKRFDVTIEHLPAPDDRKLELQVSSAVRSLVQTGLDGHVLVFLPGAAEIRRAMESCEKLASEHDLALLPLHGDLSPADQDRAVGPSSRRKIILSTNVAESSVTIEGIVAVVDSGLVRVVRHASWSGLPTLAIEKTSRASAVQRAGRAGRTRAGKALRLYTKADFEARPEHDSPEIQRVDLSQTMLELHAAGASDLAWLDAPKPDAWRAAETLLGRLGAIDEGGKVTSIGKRMLDFPLHPRQARMLVEAEKRNVAEDGVVLAALIGERDLRSSSKTRFDGGGHAGRALDVATEQSDVLALLDLYREAEASGFSGHALRAIGLDQGSVHSASRAEKQLSRVVRRKGEGKGERPTGQAYDDALRLAILAGFPDRVARRKKQGSRDLALAEGGTAELSETSAVRDAPWMVAVSAELVRGRTLVRVASGIEPEWLIELFEDRIREVADVTFDEAKGAVVGSSKMLYDGLAIAESKGFDKNDPRVCQLLFDRVKAKGFRSLAPDDALDRWLARVRFASSQDSTIRAPSDDDVANTVRAMCAGKTLLRELEGADLLGTLRAETGSWARIDELAPDRITLASGRAAKVEYDDGKPPWLESYLQDFFGTKTTPHAGRVPIVLHLLAPNKRAVQVTTDLTGFWDRHYPTIRKELMRKYPRHAWPEDTSVPVPMKPRRNG